MLHGASFYWKCAVSRELHLDPGDALGVERFAKERGFIDADESVRSVSKAGEGNMNLTLRVVTDRRSLIVKQARPWVEKYPQIPAPDTRALVEIAFYEAATTRASLRDAMPKLLGSDSDARVVALEDLGEARDFTNLYAGAKLSEDELDALVSYLITLHVHWRELPKIFVNREMRALNHEHIFRLPLAPDNGIDLDAFTPGLQTVAEPLKGDADYVARVTELGEMYLSDGDTLVHGDYFPGSWLRTDDGVRIIDPEFCFLGSPAFDVGVMLAHLYLADHRVDRVLERYAADDETTTLSRRFAGVEIMRRLIGVAQLPLTYGADRKQELLELSRKARSGRVSPRRFATGLVVLLASAHFIHDVFTRIPRSPAPAHHRQARPHALPSEHPCGVDASALFFQPASRLVRRSFADAPVVRRYRARGLGLADVFDRLSAVVCPCSPSYCSPRGSRCRAFTCPHRCSSIKSPAATSGGA